MTGTVLITGATSGLGKSLAEVFAENSYNLILTGRNEKNLVEIGASALSRGVSCSLVCGDLKDEGVRNQLAKEAERNNLEILINNAGVYSNGRIVELKDQDFEDVLETNLFAPMKLTQKIYPIFAAKKGGEIINIGSIDGIYPKGYQTSYGASKFGLRGFTETLKFEAKSDNIRVMGVYLGGMNTHMYQVPGKDTKNLMNPREVAEIIFNCSKRYQTAGLDEIVINRQIY